MNLNVFRLVLRNISELTIKEIKEAIETAIDHPNEDTAC